VEQPLPRAFAQRRVKVHSALKENRMHVKWESPHRLFISGTQQHSFVHLQVNKPNGFQNLACYVPVNAEYIKSSFHRDGGWHQICEQKDGDNYFAIRCIHLTEGNIVWVVDHRNNVPGDCLTYVPVVFLDELIKTYKK
jgi:hypothetical protein